ncbi:MAG: hypothetical protein JWM88_376 [Verrucomicrobia bacterium]|nr:hypothetical protein [Verrucomicrobiota bacterium]
MGLHCAMSENSREPEPPEPPRREFRFKPTTFERANPATGAENNPPIDVRDIFRQASAGPPKPRATPDPAANEVHDILRANLARENETGRNDVAPEPRRASRRKRDYWFLLLGGYLLFAIIAVISRNYVVLVFGGAGMILYTLGVTWIMWHVMDDY